MLERYDSSNPELLQVYNLSDFIEYRLIFGIPHICLLNFKILHFYCSLPIHYINHCFKIKKQLEIVVDIILAMI